MHVLASGAAGHPAAAFRRQRQHVDEQRSAGAVPAASRRAVRMLPTVVVTAEDLVDEGNRECCICLEENAVGHRVKRLPCGHLFHPPCIEAWLTRHCTCPTCRFELETDDPQYEAGRAVRMAGRRPRYRRWELEKMRITELRALCARLDINIHTAVDKPDLVARIVESDKIDVVAAPPPAEFRLSELRAMGVSELRRAMLDVGVSFHPRDVVEKEDIVQLFLSSGRVLVLAEEGDPIRSADGEDSKKRRLEAATAAHDGDATTRGPAGVEDRLGAVALGGETPADAASWMEPVGDPATAPPPPVEEGDGEAVEVATDGDVAYAPSAPELPAPRPPPCAPLSPGPVPAPPRASGHEDPHGTPVGLISQLNSKSVAQLRRLAMTYDADLSACVEKKEIVDVIARAMVGNEW